MKNCVVYCRFSSANQNERSIEGQLDDCRRYADSHNLSIIGTYIDRARSGTEAEHRTAFQKMISDSANQSFDTVLVWKQDRFSRNRYDFAYYKSKLRQNGVTVFSINEPTAADDPTSIILDGLIESMAEYYSANLSQNVKRGMRIAKQHGFFTGGKPPFGYKVDGKHLVIDDDEAVIVRYVFDSYKNGHTMKEIASYLNEKGYRPRNGNSFTVKSFQHTLRNRRYIGEYSQEETNQTIPALIDEETFHAVQKMLYAVRNAPQTRKATVPYLLQGKVFCGLCGAPLVGDSGRGKGGNVYHYYSCSAHKKDHTCTKKRENKEALESSVIKQTVSHLRSPKLLDEIAQGLFEAFGTDTDVIRRTELEKHISDLQAEIDNGVNLLLSGTLPPSTTKIISNRIEELTVQQSASRDELSVLSVTASKPFSIYDCKKLILDITDGDPEDDEFSRGLLSFINSVYVFDDRLLIFYSMDDNEPRLSYEDAMNSMCSDSAPIPQPTVVVSEHITISPYLFGFYCTK